MKTTISVAPLAAGLLLALNVAAQEHSQHQMPMPAAQDHSQHQMPAMQEHTQHQVKPKAKPKVKPKPKPKAKPVTTTKAKTEGEARHHIEAESNGACCANGSRGHGPRDASAGAGRHGA